MSSNNWWDEYRGIPYEVNGHTRQGCNCWGIVALVYREQLGIELPLYTGEFNDTERIPLDEINGIRESSWREVYEDDVREFDTVLFNVSGHFHIGVVFNPRRKRFVHCMAGHHVCCESYGSIAWKSRFRGVWRHIDAA